MYMQARYYDPVIGRFYSNDPIGYRDVHSFNRYAYSNNNPYKYFDPDGRRTIRFQFQLEGKLGSIVNGALGLQSTGGAVAVGGAVSFPTGDGAIFDAGLTFSGAATDVESTPTLPSLPGGSVGLIVGANDGSVSDLRGQSTTVKVNANIGKKASKKIVKTIGNALPKGKVKDFVNGPVQKAANAALGLVVSAGVSSNGNGNVNGIEVGISKGINNGASADVGATYACTLRTGCE